MSSSGESVGSKLLSSSSMAMALSVVMLLVGDVEKFVISSPLELSLGNLLSMVANIAVSVCCFDGCAGR